jgi:hypothetical protein
MAREQSRLMPGRQRNAPSERRRVRHGGNRLGSLRGPAAALACLISLAAWVPAEQSGAETTLTQTTSARESPAILAEFAVRQFAPERDSD